MERVVASQQKGAAFGATQKIESFRKEKSGSTAVREPSFSNDISSSTLATEASSTFGSWSMSNHSSSHSSKGGDVYALKNVATESSSSEVSDLDASKSWQLGQSFCQFDNDDWWEDSAHEKTHQRDRMFSSGTGACVFQEVTPRMHHGMDAVPFGKFATAAPKQRSRLNDVSRLHKQTAPGLELSGSNHRAEDSAERSKITATKVIALKGSCRDTPKLIEKTCSDRPLRRSSTMEVPKGESRQSFRRTGSLEYLKQSKRALHETTGNATFHTTLDKASANKSRKPVERRSSAVTRQPSKPKLLLTAQRPPLRRASSFESILSDEKGVVKLHTVRASLYGASSLLDDCLLKPKHSTEPVAHSTECPKPALSRTGSVSKGLQSTEALRRFMTNEQSSSNKQSSKKGRPLLQRSASFESVIDSDTASAKKHPGFLERSDSHRPETGSRRTSMARTTSIDKRMSRRQSSTRLMGANREETRDKPSSHKVPKPSCADPPTSAAAVRTGPPRVQSHRASKEARRDPRRVQSSREMKRERSVRGNSEKPAVFAEAGEEHDGPKETILPVAPQPHPLTTQIEKQRALCNTSTA